MTRFQDRAAGAALIVSAGLIVLMMSHHPSSAQAIALGRFVHGVMILLIAVTGYGFLHMARRLGLARPPVLMGVAAYMIGSFASIGAATINGFVVTGLVVRGVTDHNLFMLAWEANQALARLGVVASGAAFLLWSLALIRVGGWPARALAVLGIAAGAGPMVLLGSGTLGMNLAGAILIYGLQAAWIAAAGFYLWTGRFTDDLAA